MARLAAFVALVVLAAGVLWWQVQSRPAKLPRYVEGPLSGFELGCSEDKQTIDRARFVSSLDLDGDGQPDHIFDIAQGCEANRLLYCNASEGCLIDVFLSSTSMNQLGIKVKWWKPLQHEGRLVLEVALAGEACLPAASPCRKKVLWDGRNLVLR